MKIKQIPQDFIVDEIYDLEKLKEKDEGKGNIYYYFKLTKKDYAQVRALEIIARIFNTSRKLVHFAGTKDKVGITSQLVSIRGINEKTFDKNIEFFNSRFEDMELEFLGKFNSRLNLGDNLGNRFKIVIRDLEEKDIAHAREKVDDILDNGVLNFFDEQRFGYANNSHIVGKYILQNNLEKAVREILTSLPPSPSEDLEIFVRFIEKNFDKIKESNAEIIDEAISLAPRFLRGEVTMLKHLKRFINDFPGAFRHIHKKLRTLYLNAYQSYIFNETITKLKKNNKIKYYIKIPLISFDTILDDNLKEIIDNLIKKDNIKLEDFRLPSMPELSAESVMRETIVEVATLEVNEEQKDELNEGKLKVEVVFDLTKGAYATNVIKQLFN